MTKKTPQPLFLFCLLLASVQSAQAQIAPSAASQQYTIHEDLLKCYHSIGRAAEEEAEYKWLLAARPSNALLHYNYAVLLKTAGKYPAASVQYEKAAQFEGSNVDYVGQCGQIFFYTKNYQKAYQYLGKAMQMPGGEKYKSSFDQVREYLQNIQFEIQRKQMLTPGGKKGPGATLGPKKNDDDDD